MTKSPPLVPFVFALLLVFVAACADSSSLETVTPADPTRPASSFAAPGIASAPSATPRSYPYPPPASQTPAAYPGETPTRSGTTRVPRTITPESRLYLPSMQIVAGPTATPTPLPTETPSPTPTPTPTVDFAAVRAELNAAGEELGFVKVGFHVGPGGNQNGIGEWMRRLDAAGVPFFLKSVDSAGPLFEAQEIVRSSNVPHTLVFRTSGDEYDVPDYSLPPAEAARQHWDLHMAAFPPELDPSIVWLETINEVDKNMSPWLAEFALVTAQLALQDGFRWAAFGWASGEPERADWELPRMREFLRLAAANPERLAVALHEYSYTIDDIANDYPHLVGRFQDLFAVTDQYGISRPTVLVTEWGWEYADVPPSGEAMEDIAWASGLYAPYPQVKGAAIWYLGPGFGGIADQTQPLIKPVTEYALGNYFGIPMPPEQAPIAPDAYRP